MQSNPFVASHLRTVVAIAILAALYAASRLSAVSSPLPEPGRFRFSRHMLPEVAGPESRTSRPVHPSLAGIQSWISAVGASVALGDLDGNGLPDDVCYVDTRTDQVVVAPAAGTASRYRPFALPLASIGYDRSTMAPMGCLPGDFNEDGGIDLLIYFWGRPPALFLKRDRLGMPGPGAYSAQNMADPKERWYTNSAVVGDIDGDGRLDVVVSNYFPDGSRILDAGDSNKQHMQHSMSRAFNGGRKHLLLSCHAPGSNQACFKEAPNAFPEEVQNSWTLATGVADLDGDLLPEIYFANDFGPDRLLHNRSHPGAPSFALIEGRRGFFTPKSKVLGHDSFKGMGVDFGDVNGDGVPDIFVSNIAAEYALEESHFVFLSQGPVSLMRRGIAPYVDHSEDMRLSRTGWAWDVRLGDFDNDGQLEVLRAGGFVKGNVNRWPELHELAMGNDQLLSNPSDWPRVRAGDDLSGGDRNSFSVRSASGEYVDIASALGVEGPFVTRGIATADVDGDGKLDFAVANQWQSSILFRNESPVSNAYLGLHLLRPCAAAAKSGAQASAGHEHGCASPAIGTLVKATLPGGRTISAQSDGGSGHSGKRSPDVLLGLGQMPSTAEVQVDLRWRDRNGVERASHLALHPGWHSVLVD